MSMLCARLISILIPALRLVGLGHPAAGDASGDCLAVDRREATGAWDLRLGRGLWRVVNLAARSAADVRQLRDRFCF